MESSSSTLQRYRNDRRKLLEFLLSSDLIKEIRTPSGPAASISDLDFDLISADYVIQCVQSDGVIDMLKATKKHTEESAYPITVQSSSGDSFFLVSDLESAGSPPRHTPPPKEPNYRSRDGQLSFGWPESLVGKNVTVYGDDYEVNQIYSAPSAPQSARKTDVPSLGLPTLKTGLSDDELRESAYEILLACTAFSGVTIFTLEDPKIDRSSKFLSGLKNRRDRRHARSQSVECRLDHVDTIRVQMQISETVDACIRRKLMAYARKKAGAQIDVPQVLLELLSSMLKSDFPHERLYFQWRKRQLNSLEEIFSFVNHVTTEPQAIEDVVEKIRYIKKWDTVMPPSEQAELLLSIGHIASKLSFLCGNFDVQGEIRYWMSSYPLNIRLYEKLLFGIFDVLEEGQLIEEADEFMKLVKLTWPFLGITQKMHDILYGWVLFQQFVGTEEVMLLDHANSVVQEFSSAEESDEKEEQYMRGLLCTVVNNSSRARLSLVKAILRLMNLWCDTKLQDYHSNFSQKPSLFRMVVSLALAVGTYYSGKSAEIKLMNDVAATTVRMYIERSVQAACRRVEETLELVSKLERKHHFASLASELRQIAERELNVFCPILQQWCPNSEMVSSILIHQYYGERLKPFLKGVSCLSDEVRSALSASYILENELIRLHSYNLKENGSCSPSIQKFDRYQIREICGPIIIDWLISQHNRVMEWTGRALKLEVWEPLSHQQKQAASAVEVFRIIEETVDQLFGLLLPMDMSHLQALLSIIFHSVDSYLQNLVSQLVEKQHLYPAAPSLTRYKETVFPITKKKIVESVILEEEVIDKLTRLTVAKLCIRLNTLQYIQNQVSILKDGIRKSWSSALQSENYGCTEEPPGTSDNVLTSSESVDELFAATFDSIRDSAANAIRQLVDFTGTRVVFWDLREPYLFRLYSSTVEGARLENILPHLDGLLNRVCGLIDDALRDLLVRSICRASLEGFVWILLDGGPSRSFSDSDVTMMEDDLHMLKDLFVAEGEGLPRSLVELEAKLAHQILSLFSLPTESVIQMLMTASQCVSTVQGLNKHGRRSLDDADTLIRVLCHKKDTEASHFLKLHYQLPASSGAYFCAASQLYSALALFLSRLFGMLIVIGNHQLPLLSLPKDLNVIPIFP